MGIVGQTQRGMLRPFVSALVLTLCCFDPATAAPVVEELVVRGGLPPSPGAKAYAETVFLPADLVAASPRLDDQLRQAPGFGLFRRASSRDAHPTTQGASLRGIGPNGAGRTLILLDGVPQNDPFGGWVYWSALPSDGIAAVSVLRGGGAGPWGNSALAGTVRIMTEPLNETSAIFHTAAGNQKTLDIQGRAGVVLGPWTMALSASRFETDGHFALPRQMRGVIDRRLQSDATWARLKLGHEGGDGRRLTLSLGIADEARVNGTALAVNETDGYDAALRYVAQGNDSNGVEATLYAVDRTFKNVFTAATPDRVSEVPALDQFDVPSRAVGGNVIWRRPWGTVTVELGGDIRWADGTTRERFLFQGGAFRRVRQAGGEQLAAGMFLEATQDLGGATRLTGGVRLDYLVDFDGRRREINTDTDTVLRDDRFGRRSRAVLNGRLGLAHQFGSGMQARVAAYSGFRQPTINELYRPFRVRNDITEANPGLKDERLLGVDGGVTWQPTAALKMSIGGFWTILYDGVANVLIADTPGFFPDFGVFLPAGGTLSQRRNLDRIRTRGLEAEVRWQPNEKVSVAWSYLLVGAAVTAARDDPALVGNRPPQTARHQSSLALRWSPVADLELAAVARGESRQFDDAANTRVLKSYATADLSARWRVTEYVALSAAVENVTDAAIETARSADGLLTVGTPRLWRVGIDTRF